MSEELVEELAKRLIELSLIAAWEPSDAGAKRCARECLRQMEWARRGDPNAKSQNFYPGQGQEIIHDPEIGYGYTPLSWVPMTLAPEGWKP